MPPTMWTAKELPAAPRLQKVPGQRLAGPDHPHQLNRTYFRARLNQTGPKYSFDLVEAGNKLGLQCSDTRPGGKIGLQC